MIKAGDRVLLWEASTGRRYLVHLDGSGAQKHRGLGVFDAGRLEGTTWGAAVDVNGKQMLAWPPRRDDLHATLRRKAQIIGGKDMGQILWHLGIGPGDRVFESGIGSAAATISLAHAVGADGRVVVQELRDDFADWGRDNLDRAGLADRVDIHVGDLGTGLADGIRGPFDAFLLDLPEPWLAVPHLATIAAPGAPIVAYVPQVSQFEAAVHALEPLAEDIGVRECIERHWAVRQRGSRPAFDGLGHTGFLVTARLRGTTDD